MTSGQATNDRGRRPALVVVDDGAVSRQLTAGSLRRRYGTDYEVIDLDSSTAAAAKLRKLRDAGADVAVIAANVKLDGDGTRFLGQTRDAYPNARRLVLSAVGDNWTLPTIAHAAALGLVDHWEYLPSSESDEHFLAVIADILADWTHEMGRGNPRITIIGELGDPDFTVLTEVLQRWEPQPIRTMEAGTPEADAFLKERSISGPLPIVAVADGRAVTGANIANLSDAIGSGVDPRETTFDVTVIGLGPAGFSAAVNAASEGLRVILVNDTFSQASSSPLVRNYLGFPAGVTGAELMRRAWAQAMMFGAVARIGRTATDLRRERGQVVVTLDDGSEITTHAVMLATGVDYRRIGVESIDRLVGRGVFYGYGALEAQAMTGADAAVVGGANSAVQAALHVARYARSVRLIVRGSSLSESASEYLVTQLDGQSNLTLHLDSEVVDAADAQRLRSVTVRNRRSDEATQMPLSGLFIMIGASPRTEWLPKEIARDDRGYVLTGEDAPAPASPKDARLPFETTMPGVFALGDVRSGSVKRIAAAVGEGSAAVQQVHRYLQQLAESAPKEQAPLGKAIPIETMHAEIAAASRR
ncbi:MAG TPA: FAD-dependent oxidoreductase [Candidatus Limnocylindria bacterium]|nr:FAD-dependent oxidoreductase [Candidatus Limnocylindria bacterium]